MKKLLSLLLALVLCLGVLIGCDTPDESSSSEESSEESSELPTSTSLGTVEELKIAVKIIVNFYILAFFAFRKRANKHKKRKK